MYFGTEGGKATEISKKLESLGFRGAFGPVDFTYEWANKPSKEQVLNLADKVMVALKDTGSVFNLDTHD